MVENGLKRNEIDFLWARRRANSWLVGLPELTQYLCVNSRLRDATCSRPEHYSFGVFCSAGFGGDPLRVPIPISSVVNLGKTISCPRPTKLT